MKHRELRRTIISVSAALLAATLGACLDDLFTGPSREAPASIVMLSDTSGGNSVAGLGMPGVTYVSLAPGSVEDGIVATIRNRRTSHTVSAAMTSGGFDPVGIPAFPGDTLEINAQGAITTALLLSVVPTRRRPTVVRTIPPRGKTGIPLNARMTVVFSEPIDRATITSTTLQLTRNGTPVAGEIIVRSDNMIVDFAPATLLVAGAEYELRALTGIRDMDGDPLETILTSTFTTGNTPVTASISTEQTALFANPFNGEMRTFQVNAARLQDGSVVGTFSVLYPGTGGRTTGRVTCFTIVDGRAAWMSGVVEEAGNTALIGVTGGWRVVDNGPAGGGVPDQLSLIHWFMEDWPITDEQFCESTPESGPDEPVTLQTVASGDIVLNDGNAVLAPPSGGVLSRLAFAAWPNGGIRTMRADGFDSRVLTSTEGDWNPAWSPDGSRIAFDRNGAGQLGGADIWVMKADGSGLQRLTSGTSFDAHPTWSPDGKKIAFYRSGQIYAMNADGSGIIQLSSDGDNPKWSPVEPRIAFWSARTNRRAVYVMNADGSDQRSITHDSLDASNPSWSPDGQWIAFQGSNGIYVARADGTSLQRIAYSGQTPAWSPDGKMIVYEWFGLNVITADGAGLTKRGPGFTPAWSAGAMPPAPVTSTMIAIVDGDGQAGALKTVLPKALRVRLTRDGAPIAGRRVNFVFTHNYPNGHSLSTNNANTDADGVAGVTVTLGDRAEDLVIVAQVTDGSALTPGVVFRARALDPAKATLKVSVRTSGPNQGLFGYRICIDPQPEPDWGYDCGRESVGKNIDAAITVAAGNRVLYLEDVPINCSVLDSNPRPVSVPSMGEASVDFRIECLSADELLPYGAAAYRYKVLADTTQSSGGFESLSFDDLLLENGFATGAAAFGSDTFDGCELAQTVRTSWDVGTDLLIRKTFVVPAGVTNVRIGMAIDNDAQVFVNGVDITAAGAGPALTRGFARHGGCATPDSFVFAIPAANLRAGTNLIAVRARDRGQESFFDLRVVALKP